MSRPRTQLKPATHQPVSRHTGGTTMPVTEANLRDGPSQFRPLLPQPPRSLLQPRSSQSDRASSASSEGRVQLTPRRPHTKNACEPCRQRKIKCNGKRPACSSCVNDGKNCQYNANPQESRSTATKRKLDETRDRLSRHGELYSLLKTRSLPEVSEILRRIRAGGDIDSILRYVKDGDLLLQLNLAPETRLRYTFPDFAAWKTIFHDPDDPYLKAQLLDFPTKTQRQKEQGPLSIQSLTTPNVPPDQHIYQMPYHSAHTIDPRIQSVKAATWTSVTTDDALVANLLGIYFQYEFPRARPFQKDLFLDDLARGHTRFCSPLLVNAVLANAAHGLTSDPRRVEFWTPRSLPYSFLAEAKRMWDLEIMGKPKLTMVHAAMVLSLRYGSDGADVIGVGLINKAIEMADQLEMFTRPEKGDTKMSRARLFTAWSLWSWHVMTCYYQLKVPKAPHAPITPLPDDDSIERLTGELYLKYPLQSTLTPIRMPNTFKYHTALNIMMHEINIARSAISGGKPEPAPLPLGQTMDFYDRLSSWYQSLPEELQPNRIAMPHHFHIHMEYYLVLINLLEPWTSGRTSPLPHDTRFSSGHTLPEVATLARARLETLIRLYYLRHSFESLDVILIMYLLLMGSIAVRIVGPAPASSSPPPSSHESHPSPAPSSSSPSTTTASSTPGPPSTTVNSNPLASTFLLCAKGLHDQGRNHYTGALMFDMLASLVDPANAPLVSDLARIRAEFRGTEVKPEYVHMDWPVYRWVHPERVTMGRVLEGMEGLGFGEGEEDEEAGDGEEEED